MLNIYNIHTVNKLGMLLLVALGIHFQSFLFFHSGEIQDLFSEEEVEGIIAGLRAEVRASGLMDSNENCWRFFSDRVRQLLTVLPLIVYLLIYCRSPQCRIDNKQQSSGFRFSMH